jgi:23S rRNA G2069 N7-methylase RlmK/C1962 C5-methylase RlmI
MRIGASCAIRDAGRLEGGHAVSDARRRVQIVERRTQSSDHPVLLGVPETLYLKCVVARAIE